MINSTVMMRKDFVEANKLSYREECVVCQDYSFFVDAALVGNIENMNISTINIEQVMKILQRSLKQKKLI